MRDRIKATDLDPLVLACESNFNTPGYKKMYNEREQFFRPTLSSSAPGHCPALVDASALPSAAAAAAAAAGPPHAPVAPAGRNYIDNGYHCNADDSIV